MPRFLVAFVAIVAAVLLLAVLLFPPVPHTPLIVAVVAVGLALIMLAILRAKHEPTPRHRSRRRAYSILAPLLGLGLLGLAACASTARLETFNTNAQTALLAAQQTVASDARLGLIDPATAAKVNGSINAANAALEAANDALMAHDATTAQQKQQEVQAAILEINNAILAAVKVAATP